MVLLVVQSITVINGLKIRTPPPAPGPHEAYLITHIQISKITSGTRNITVRLWSECVCVFIKTVCVYEKPHIAGTWCVHIL